MLGNPACSYRKQNGETCRATPLRERDLCFWHDPEFSEDAAQARRLGGQRRKRESTLSGAYDFHGLRTPEDARRLMEIAAMDALSLDNSIVRVRALTAIASGVLKVFEVTDLDERLQAIESLMEKRKDRSRDRGDESHWTTTSPTPGDGTGTGTRASSEPGPAGLTRHESGAGGSVPPHGMA